MKKNFSNGKIVFQSEGIVGKLLKNTNSCEFVQLNIGENKIIESHVLNVPVSFFVIQGYAELTIDEKKYILTTGDLISVDSGLTRAWINKGEQELKLLAVKEI